MLIQTDRLFPFCIREVDALTLEDFKNSDPYVGPFTLQEISYFYHKVKSWDITLESGQFADPFEIGNAKIDSPLVGTCRFWKRDSSSGSRTEFDKLCYPRPRGELSAIELKSETRCAEPSSWSDFALGSVSYSSPTIPPEFVFAGASYSFGATTRLEIHFDLTIVHEGGYYILVKSTSYMSFFIEYYDGDDCSVYDWIGTSKFITSSGLDSSNASTLFMGKTLPLLSDFLVEHAWPESDEMAAPTFAVSEEWP